MNWRETRREAARYLRTETQVDIIVVVLLYAVCMETLYNCEVLFCYFFKLTNGGGKN